jgi:hypothetical protein
VNELDCLFVPVNLLDNLNYSLRLSFLLPFVSPFCSPCGGAKLLYRHHQLNLPHALCK